MICERSWLRKLQVDGVFLDLHGHGVRDSWFKEAGVPWYDLLKVIEIGHRTPWLRYCHVARSSSQELVKFA